MIRASFFYQELAAYGINFYTGVPDSLLKNLCAYVTDHAGNHIIAANEGGAMGIAAGHYLATGQIPVVYMQNSGEGNIINPLASLVDKEVYNIPVLLVIGWRGKPGVHDEPQHVKQGKVTLSLLETMGIPYTVLSKEETEASLQIKQAVESIQQSKECYALIIEKDTFEPYQLSSVTAHPELSLSREEAIGIVASAIGPKDVIVSTTGMISRELFEYRTRNHQGHERDFLTVGSMGHASQIALGIALEKRDRRVWCFDGDGAAIMHLGGMAIVGSQAPRNYVHVVFNNGAHDSVGGQPTVGLDIDLPTIAKAAGYKQVVSVSSKEELERCLDYARHDKVGGSRHDNKGGSRHDNEGGSRHDNEGGSRHDNEGGNFSPFLLEVRVKKGNRKDLGRPTTTPIENKEALMDFLKQ